MLGIFTELKFCVTDIYFLNKHKNVTCSFISLLQCISGKHTTMACYWHSQLHRTLSRAIIYMYNTCGIYSFKCMQ